MKITIPYTPRPLWEKEIHPSLEKFRYSDTTIQKRKWGG